MAKLFRIIILPFLFPAIQTFGQSVISGFVVDESTKTPISFANIGIINSRIGTISNKDGSFKIEVPEAFSTDTLTFFALGFSQKSIPLSVLRLRKGSTVFLRPKEIILEEFAVHSKKEKRLEFDLGNRYSKAGLNMSSAEDANAGTSVALLVQNKYPSFHEKLTYPVFLQSAKLRIYDNTVGPFKIRVRIYEVDSLTKLPGKDILNESLVLESEIKKGWINFDLTQFNLVVKGPFFLAFEWIMEENERNELKAVYREFEAKFPERVVMDTSLVDGEKLAVRHYINFLPGTVFGVSLLPFSLANYETYSRSNSLGQWERVPYILTARVRVSSQPSSQDLDSIAEKAKNDFQCPDEPQLCEVRGILRDFVDENSIVGSQLAVSVNGELILSESYGESDLEKMTPVTNQTQFRIGSISKSLTSAALIQLASEGKLDLDTDIRSYIPSFPQKPYPFNTRQLAGHLAGIRHYRDNDPGDLIRFEHFENAKDALAVFQSDSLLFEPGTKFHYSSYGWNLLGAIIEQVSGKNYLDYMREEIWLPLSMTQTYGDVTDSIMPYRSSFYYLTGEQAEADDLSYKYASGGLLSTAEDLVKYGNELLYGDFFEQMRVRELFETQKTADSEPTNYGIGWNIQKDRNGHRVWFHAGNLLESSAYLLILPDDGIVVAFLANSGGGLAFDIQKIAENFYSKKDR